jgi:hypothetical protein
MKYSICSAVYCDPKSFIEEYGTILETDFGLERSEDGRFFYITLNSLEDMEKLSEAVRSSIIFETAGSLIIYDGYME